MIQLLQDFRFSKQCFSQFRYSETQHCFGGWGRRHITWHCRETPCLNLRGQTSNSDFL